MSIARTVCLVLGAVYILVGILGFIPGVAEEVAGVDEMESATALLLGIFPINLLHNIVHLVIGAVLLWGATATDANNEGVWRVGPDGQGQLLVRSAWPVPAESGLLREHQYGLRRRVPHGNIELEPGRAIG